MLGTPRGCTTDASKENVFKFMGNFGQKFFKGEVVNNLFRGNVKRYL